MPHKQCKVHKSINQQQQHHRLRTDSSLSHRGGGGGGFNEFYWVQIVALYLIKLTHNDETKKRDYDSQIVRGKENLKLSYGAPSQGQASGTNQRLKALRQGRH